MAEEIRCMVCSRQLVANPLFPDVLAACPMCGRLFCRDCAVKRGGREFCGSRCGDTFFFAGEEGDSELADE
ncbi:MAG TPA: hypothetical protein VKH46_00760 [Thermoanaerobaculia bacterium]|jgi:hypothetical protein|nr:hypothetical protein [Thermoanaerobaculia bacterium]